MATFKQSAVIFDLDGVLCNNSRELHEYMERNPYPKDEYGYWHPWHQTLHQYPPAEEYKCLAGMMRDAGHHVVVLTARPIDIIVPTYEWLDSNEIQFDVLKMSPGGDGSFHTSKEAHLVALMAEFNVLLAIDDSQHWCDMYRRFGIPTLFVNHGLRSIAPA